jgi:dolichol kinase
MHAEFGLLFLNAGQIAYQLGSHDGFVLESALIVLYTLAAAFVSFPFLACDSSKSKLKLRKDGDSRSGALLGLLLGPFVLAAKLHLASLAPSQEPQNVAYYQFYLWLSLACGVCAIVYGALVHHSAALLAALGTACALPYLIAPFLSEVGWLTAAPPLVLFCLALWALLTHFPRCFTFGEAAVLAQAFSLFVFDALYYTCAFLQLDVASYLSQPRDEMQMFLTGLIPGILLCGTVLFSTIRKSAQVSRERDAFLYSKAKGPSGLDKGWQLAIGFYAGTLGIVVLFIHPWLSYMINGREPIFWTLRFVFGEQMRIFMCVFWVGALGGCLALIEKLKLLWPSIPNILVRKYFHALSLLLFIPAILFELQFMKLSFGVALAGLIFVEYLRLGKIAPLGEKIDTFMRSFIDERDSGSLILTHLYLLVGCAAPVWLYTPANPSEDVHFLLPYLGVLLVGLGDSFASLAGMYLGRIKWPHTKKTVEGTMAAVAVVLLAGLLLSLLYPFVSLSFGQWLGFAWAVMCGCLLEAFTTQIDNLALPLYAYAVLCFSLAA